MPKSLTIGSRTDCDLVVSVSSVSGHHCRLTRNSTGYLLEDLNSTNGTFFNGERVRGSTSVSLKPGDTIHLGSHSLDVQQVLALFDEEPTESLEFRGQELVIGRNPGCDHVIDQSMVSSRHARLFRSGDHVFLEDLSSANGTFVNGERIQEATKVEPGDTISLGSHSLVLRATSGELPIEAAATRNLPVPQTVPTTARGVFADPWPVLALLAQAPLAAVLIVGLAGSSIPPTLFGLGIAATWFGLSDGMLSHLVDRMLERQGWPAVGVGSSRFVVRILVVVAICAAQCVLVWLLMSSLAELRAAGIPAMGLLLLAGLVGLAMSLLVVTLVPRLVLSWTCVILLVAALWLLGGLYPSIQGLPAWVRPLASLLPSRWAFEGLILLETKETVPATPGSEAQADPRQDLAETYFPSATERMGLAADTLALVLMLIGLTCLVAFLSIKPLIARSDSTHETEPAHGTS
jgi:pSer/pThr/pTyr-binding forkhead associated (FHA) protein